MTVLKNKIELHNIDNMHFMSSLNDNAFDLAIVDPPYGIKEKSHRENKSRSKLARSKDYNNALWLQDRPTEEYFNELKRISKNQIIWGANHLADLTNMSSSAWIVWNKKVMSGKGNHFADCELAYTSFKKAVRSFEFIWQGMIQGNMKEKEIRIHPTQKPVKLYEWILHNYAKEGDKIFDSHLGSGSIAIACHNLGFELTACEIDKSYFEDAKKRINNHIKQVKLF